MYMSGFVYLWYDKKHKKFYVGSHWGKENDGYVCSNDSMRDNYKRRSKDFKRRIIARITTNRNDLLREEYRWLKMIKPYEFKRKYYNRNAHNHTNYWWMNKETKKQVSQKISENTKEAMKRPEVRKKYLKGLKTRPYNTDPLKKGEASKRNWSNPIFKEKTSKAISDGSINNPKKKQAMLQCWQDPEYIAKQSKAHLIAMQSPEYKAAQSIRIKEVWARRKAINTIS